MSRKAKIERLKKEVDTVSAQIIDLGDEIKIRTKHLHHEHHSITHGRIAKSRQSADSQAIAVDRVLRPSDRDNGIRTYSKMDLDIWKYDDVRKWFNTGASEEPEIQEKSPSETGYMISRV